MARPKPKPSRRGSRGTPAKAKSRGRGSAKAATKAARAPKPDGPPVWWPRVKTTARITAVVLVIAAVVVGIGSGLRWADHRAMAAWENGDLAGWQRTAGGPAPGAGADRPPTGHLVGFSGVPTTESARLAWMPDAREIQARVDSIAMDAAGPFDPEPLARIAALFSPGGELDGWIEGGLRVERDSDGLIVVGAAWREPAAVVGSRTFPGGVRVNADGLPLPGFDTPDTATLPFIQGLRVPSGRGEPERYDLPWPSPDVLEALGLLAYLDRPIFTAASATTAAEDAGPAGPKFSDFVAGVSVSLNRSGVPFFTLHTEEGGESFWGAYPFRPELGEADDAVKLDHLRRNYTQAGGLTFRSDVPGDAVNAPVRVDLTGPNVRLVAP